MRPVRCCLAVAAALLCLWCAGALADAPVDDAAERDGLRAERAAAEAIYQQQAAACSTVFAVTACTDEARARRHATLSQVDQRLRALDDAARRQRAQERLQAIDSKQAGDEARRREELARERAGGRAAAAKEPKAAASQASAPSPRKAPLAPASAARSAQEASARQAFEMKQVQAEAHRQEVARRNQARALKANPGMPLPVPAASAASS